MTFAATAKSIALSAILVTALAACTPSNPTESPTAQKQYVTAPLTGIKYEVGTDQANQLARASVACKIDNSEGARPQQGLNSTDVVFDEMVEGGLTRFVAIFHSTQPEGIGPVRSIRPMDPDILTPFGGIVCYSGGQAAITAMMRATTVFNASETTEQGQGTFMRVKDRIAPHNVIVNTKLLAANHPEIAAPAAQFNFAQDLKHATAFLKGAPIKDITVSFPDAAALWTPSADATAFLRTQDGKPLIDKADGQQVHTTNIVVMQVTVDKSFKDRKYGYVPKDVVIGTGKAWVLSGGRVIECTWTKQTRETSITLTMTDGTPVQLAPGNTWVELQPLEIGGNTTINLAPTPTPSPSRSSK